MRLFVFITALSAAAFVRADEPVPAVRKPVADLLVTPAGTPALLEIAIKHYAADAERWAYTQTEIVKDSTGKRDKETVVRYDPSQPFDEQWTPLKMDGKEPTEKQIRKYRDAKAKNRKNRRSLGELLDLNKAVVVEDTPAAVTYEVALIKDGNQRLPPDKFRVTARVNKTTQAFEHVGVRLREAMRMALIFKLKSGEADLNFATIDPQFAPPMTGLHAEGEGSVFFVKVGGNYAVTRADFKRVKPYSERFKVKLAPMQFLDY